MASSSSSSLIFFFFPAPLRSVTFPRRHSCWRSSSPGVTLCCSASHDSNNPDSSASPATAGQLGVLVPQVRNGIGNISMVEINENLSSPTGGAFDFSGATTSLSPELLPSTKKVTLVRHGLSSWNEENRVQGSSNLSVLTDIGSQQAVKCRDALASIYFDQCFSSPISRAKSTAELIWHGREQPLIFLDSLKESHLFFLEGMTNESGGS